MQPVPRTVVSRPVSEAVELVPVKPVAEEVRSRPAGSVTIVNLSVNDS